MPGQAEKSGALRHVGVERTALMTLVFTGMVAGLTAWGIWSGFRAMSNVALGISSGSPSLAGLKAPIWEFSKMVKR